MYIFFSMILVGYFLRVIAFMPYVLKHEIYHFYASQIHFRVLIRLMSYLTDCKILCSVDVHIISFLQSTGNQRVTAPLSYFRLRHMVFFHFILVPPIIIIRLNSNLTCQQECEVASTFQLKIYKRYCYFSLFFVVT